MASVPFYETKIDKINWKFWNFGEYLKKFKNMKKIKILE
jgi:hypothetical protein